ncbi:DUF892 family protein [Dyadobacter subterraneus]|uniref:DUF892 family protein n=1 Tax=Dyadobacter subterraneus TaxID=2773304 RepID=A0ABR9W9N4_9BACT|nr:DUF892 family protein [Dyadobacter subterraneus]MBE9462152.1 DUF892 family protein [Dyadobacter subterraneus]
MRDTDQMDVDKADLEKFFIFHLNKIYAAKKLLVEELPSLLTSVHFSDLQEAIKDTIEAVKKQIIRMDKIFQILSTDFSSGHSAGLQGLLEDSFNDIKVYQTNPELRDMSILFYLHNIESIEMASFQILEMASVKLKNDQIKDLIKRNYQDAKADRTLFLLINAKYISTV